ncbi:MLP-like protein 28 [Vigna unguiculata]|uniref:MLP-like protein 28 n=1 Tax=Vigna unguiculata TaxID=3917 RepID=UPI0010166AE5|nr:MLP-like protein 28 [Vigna unguiculata]
MSLSGKISTELPVQATAEKWFHTVRNQLHHIQHVSGDVHGAGLDQGDDWRANDSVKHWTYTVDGRVETCHERIESVDEQKKRIAFKIFGEAIDAKYKVYKLIFEAIEKDDGSGAIKWSVEYEKVSEDVQPPYMYLEFYDHLTEDVDAHLLKADEKNARK